MGQVAISRLQNIDCVNGGGTTGPHASSPELAVSDEKISRKIMPASTTTTLASVTPNGVQKRSTNGATKLKNQLVPQLARALSPTPTNGLEPPALRISNTTGPTKLRVCSLSLSLSSYYFPANFPANFPPIFPRSPHFRPFQRILVTGGAGYIGSHTVLSLALTRRFKVVSIDNYHNSFPLALSRIEGIAAAALPPDASPDDIESANIDAWTADLTSEDQVRAVFAHYGPGAFWGVIHIAVRL